MTIQEAQSRLLFALYHLYDNTEAANIADLVMEKLTGWRRIDRVINKTVPLTKPMVTDLERFIEELSSNKPVQYVLNECWFFGFPFYVDARVLIPRPETEELVDWVLSEERSRSHPVILDVGAGSGCISIALQKNRTDASVYGIDVSNAALEVAKTNAKRLNAPVRFEIADIFESDSFRQLPPPDILVSNPPYIPKTESREMHDNVTRFEPDMALFVPDEDPLKFYSAIGDYAKDVMKPGSVVYVELHESFAAGAADLFRSKGFTDVAVKKDMQGKDRMARAILA